MINQSNTPVRLNHPGHMTSAQRGQPKRASASVSRPMELDFVGKRALVTGAGKGIGREIACLLGSFGAEVVAVGRTKADLDELAEEIGCETAIVDVADVERTKRVAEELGPVDLLVNNAGISRPQSFLETTVQDFNDTIAVNVRGVLVVSQIVARGMIERGTGGAIVNISSQASMVALHDHASYCASKGALDQLTRVMALELGPLGIRVNGLNPTVTLTPMAAMAWGDPAKSGPMLDKIPIGRFAKPLDVAYAAAYLLSDAAGMIHGVSLPVDGGYLIA